MTVVLGGDVANFQGHVDWPRVAAFGWRFAWVLATDGSSFFDAFEPEDVAGAAGVGITPGGYHFGRPALHDPIVEADWYRAHVPAELELPTMLDLERDWLASPAGNTDWALRFIDRIAPTVRVLYTNGDGATVHLDSQRLVDDGVELFYAHPGAVDFAGIGAWPSASAVQYGQGHVDGIATLVDLDAIPQDIFDRWTQGAPVTNEEIEAIAQRAAALIVGPLEDAIKAVVGNPHNVQPDGFTPVNDQLGDVLAAIHAGGGNGPSATDIAKNVRAEFAANPLTAR